MERKLPYPRLFSAIAVYLRLLIWIGAGAWIACQPGGEELAPGVVHHELHLAQGPWWIHVVEIDLPTAWQAGVRLRTAHAEPTGRLETTSSMARDAIAAVNGDFFSTGKRVRVAGLQIRNGCLLRRPQGRSAFAITRDGQPLISVFHLEAGLITSNGKHLSIAGFNQPPPAGGLSLYNYYSQVLLDSVHAEIGFQLQSLTPGSAVNDTLAVRVTQVRRKAWPLLLKRRQWLVAAAQEGLIRGVSPGDTVRIFLWLYSKERTAFRVGPIQEAIGGGPRILRDGRVSVEYAEERLSQSFAEERHPRTAVGYSRDGRILYLVTVDGRQPGYSVGMSLEELAEFMRGELAEYTRSGIGAYQALNLDGGGSTTMVIRRKVVNSPSDQTGERPVANALLVVMSKAGGDRSVVVP